MTRRKYWRWRRLARRLDKIMPDVIGAMLAVAGALILTGLVLTGGTAR